MNAGKLAAPILLMAMLMTSLMAIAIRNLVDEGLSVFDATFLRLSIAALPFSNIGDIATGMTKPSVLFNALSLGIVMTMIPYYIIGWSTRYLSPVTVAVICVSEVIFAVIIGTFYYGEPLDAQDLFGVLLLVGSIVMISFADAKKRKGKDAASPESSDPVDGEISG